MRGFVLLFLGLASILCHPQKGLGQGLKSIKPHKPVICYYSNENKPYHIGVSEKFKNWRKNASARTKTATFEVEYINFPTDNIAKEAFQFALDIWESELQSTVPVKIRAEWMRLESGVLGQAIWGSAYANFDGAQHTNTYYPVALAEKIARKDLNAPTEPDIVASFSSSIAWYYGTDGETPSGKMDLVTVVLHEIAHGLGFTDTYDVQSGQGSVGLENEDTPIPFIYDLYIDNNLSKNLFQDFISPSRALGTELQNKNLFFNSFLSKEALGGTMPRLYAPATFDAGSSISHLDETTFNAPGDPNRLMTPQIAKAESIHSPGNILLAVLSDIGWVYTRIDHIPLKDTELKNGDPYLITTLIESDNGYDPNEVKLHYTTDGVNFTVVDMIPTGVTDEFQASLPGTTDDLAYGYFISAIDNIDRAFTNPGKIEEQGKQPEQRTFFINIGPDVTPPEIVHQPAEYIFKGDTALTLTAEVTDNLAVKEVIAEYLFNGGVVQTVNMDNVVGTNEFTSTISLPADLAIDDKLEYRIVARDEAMIENIVMAPEDGYFQVSVTGIKPVQNSYFNNFNFPSGDFFGTSFKITTSEGFDDPAIHSNHPYANGTGPNEESNYVYQLQIPILIDANNPVIKFDEVVLVEPGSSGSQFGDEDFFDYVIVEGSVDGGTTWQPFLDGYDSRAQSNWLTRYNLDIQNDNSETNGEKILYHERVINMLENGNFSADEEVLLRFRLFADALAHGWGWAIDNLSIQGPVTNAEQPVTNEFKVYPVPVKEDLVVEFLNPQNDPVTIQITDLQGRIIFGEDFSTSTGTVQKNIDVRPFREGLYILKGKFGSKTFTRKFLKVSR